MTRLRIRSMSPGEEKAAWVCQFHWRRYCDQLALSHDEVYKLIRTHLDHKPSPGASTDVPPHGGNNKPFPGTLAATPRQAATPRRGVLLGGAVSAIRGGRGSVGSPASAAGGGVGGGGGGSSGGGGGGGPGPSPRAVDSVKIARDFARLERTVQDELAEMRQSMKAFHEGVQRSLEAIVSTQQEQQEQQQEQHQHQQASLMGRSSSHEGLRRGTGAPAPANTSLFLEA